MLVALVPAFLPCFTQHMLWELQGLAALLCTVFEAVSPWTYN